MKEHPTDRMMTERIEALSRDLAYDPPCEYVREGVASTSCIERRCRPDSGRCCYACTARIYVDRALLAFRGQAVVVSRVRPIGPDGEEEPLGSAGNVGRAIQALRTRGVVR